jgi:biopolymer transport protein ExbD
MKFNRRTELKRSKIEIIPMIDTMFFLLVFFMLSSLALTRLNGLPVNLPKASTAPKQPAAELTLTIDKERKVYVNMQPVALEEVGPKLLASAGGPEVDLTTASVVVNADTDVPHGMVVRCIDEAREVGISRFAIATEPEYKR